MWPRALKSSLVVGLCFFLFACGIFGRKTNSPHDGPSNLTISFQDDAYSVPLAAQIHLIDMVKFLERHPDSTVEVSGHSNRLKSDRRSLITAEWLAERVSSHLLRLGLDPNRLRTFAYNDLRSADENPRVE